MFERSDIVHLKAEENFGLFGNHDLDKVKKVSSIFLFFSSVLKIRKSLNGINVLFVIIVEINANEFLCTEYKKLERKLNRKFSIILQKIHILIQH